MSVGDLHEIHVNSDRSHMSILSPAGRHGIIANVSTQSPQYAIIVQELTKCFTLPQPLSTWWRGLRRPRSAQASATRSIVAVDCVTFQVGWGELFGLLGPNGAGKTTLIKLLCTLILPTSGQAWIAGHPLNEATHIRQVIGMASGDERSFYWRLSGRHNLEFFAALYGLDRRNAAQRAQELLEQVGLTAEADRPVRTYSSGQKQRLSIARALLHRPRILFLDEPTRSLDPIATMHLHDFIEQELVRRQGMTVFLTTHRLDEAQRLCQRIAIMDHGRLRAWGTPDELRASLGAVVRYRLRVHGLTANLDELASGLPGHVQSHWLRQPGNGLIELETSDGEAALAALIQRIVAAGGEIRDVRSERPSLEQVFQRFTRPKGD